MDAIKLILDIREASAVLDSLRSSHQMMGFDERHVEDRVRLQSVIIRLEAEIRVIRGMRGLCDR